MSTTVQPLAVASSHALSSVPICDCRSYFIMGLRGAVRLFHRWINCLPILFHVNNRPALGRGLIPRLVECANMRLPVVFHNGFAWSCAFIPSVDKLSSNPFSCQQPSSPW